MDPNVPPYRAHEWESSEEFYSHAGQVLVTGPEFRCVILMRERYGQGTAYMPTLERDKAIAEQQAKIIADVFNGMVGKFQPAIVR